MSSVKFNFEGNRVVVTGATSGIGKAIALAFANAGARLVVTGRHQQKGDALFKRLNDTYGHNQHSFLAGDITQPDFCLSLIDFSLEKLGGLDVVVNSAGIIFHANVEQTTDQIWHDTMNVNVNGVFYVCRAALKKMKQSGGVIINIASDAGLSASHHLTAYNASKGAVIQMSRSMARDYGKYNVRVIPVCPGDVDTPMLRDEFVQNGIDAKTGLKASAQAVPLNRVCTPEEVANLTLYAASDSAAFMSGYPLVLDAANRA